MFIVSIRNAIDIYVFILYPKTLMNSFVSRSFPVNSLGFSNSTVILSANRDGFISSFPIHRPCIAFSFLFQG